MPHWLTNPLTKAPSRFARKLADKVDPPTGEGGRIRGFLAGALEGAGDVLSEATSPLGMAASAIPALKPLGRLAKQSPLYGVNDTIRNSRRLIDESKDLSQLYDRIGPEFVPIGGEDIFNMVRRLKQTEKIAKGKKIAEDATRFVQHKALPISGDIDIAEMMQRVARARGR